MPVLHDLSKIPNIYFVLEIKKPRGQPWRFRGRWRSARQRLDHALDGGVVRVRVDGEAQAGHQAEHLGVGRQHIADHGTVALHAGAFDQRRHQLAADTALLPIVANGQCELDRFAVRIDHVAGNANLLFWQLNAIDVVFDCLGDGGNQRHLAVVVDLREAHQHGLRQFAQGVHEAVVARLVGHVLDELLLHVGVFRTDRADGDDLAVVHRPVLDQVYRVRVDRHVGVTVPRGADGVIDDDAGIGGDGAVFIDDQRVEVKLLNPRQFADHFRDAEQHFLQGVTVDRRHVVELTEDLRGARRVDQILGQEAVQRRQGNRAVGEDFDVETAGAEGDHRPENRIAEDADHQFAPVRTGQEGLD